MAADGQGNKSPEMSLPNGLFLQIFSLFIRERKPLCSYLHEFSFVSIKKTFFVYSNDVVAELQIHRAARNANPNLTIWCRYPKWKLDVQVRFDNIGFPVDVLTGPISFVIICWLRDSHEFLTKSKSELR
jgi:hypothetical protein